MKMLYAKFLIIVGLSFMSPALGATWPSARDLLSGAFQSYLNKCAYEQATLASMRAAVRAEDAAQMKLILAIFMGAYQIVKEAVCLPVSCVKVCCGAQDAAFDVLKGISACVLIGGGIALLKKMIEQSQQRNYIFITRY